MLVNEIRDFIFENYFKQIGLSKENNYCLMKYLKKKDLLLLANKLIEKIPDPHNAKEHYQSFIKKKNTISVKQSKIVTHQPKTFQNASIVDIISIITEHPNTSHKLSTAIRQAEKVGSNSSLHSNTKTVIQIFARGKCKNNKTRTYF